jgi:hypothetical protein
MMTTETTRSVDQSTVVSDAEEQDENDVQSDETETAAILLLDLPLSYILSFLSSSCDLFALQTTNKVFHNFSSASCMRQSFKFLYNSNVLPVQRSDDTEAIIKRFLPFAKHSNPEAIFLLGWISTYVENDLEVGMSLFQKGMEFGDLRSKYELAYLLIHSSPIKINNDDVDMMRHMGGFDDQGDVERRLDRLRRMRLDNNQEGVEKYRMMIEQQRR